MDGEVWGRGAVDMKGAVAMFVSAFLRAARGELELPGDLILVVLSDEENGGDFGAKFLVEEHPELFEGVRHALGEAGGISQVIAGKRFYPIQLGEKQICWLKATVRGPGGHGAMIHRDGTMARLARMLRRPESQADADPCHSDRPRDDRDDRGPPAPAEARADARAPQAGGRRPRASEARAEAAAGSRRCCATRSTRRSFAAATR